MHTSISAVCHVKTIQVIHKRLQNWFNYFIKMWYKNSYIQVALYVTYTSAIEVWCCWLDTVKYNDLRKHHNL